MGRAESEPLDSASARGSLTARSINTLIPRWGGPEFFTPGRPTYVDAGRRAVIVPAR